MIRTSPKLPKNLQHNVSPPFLQKFYWMKMSGSFVKCLSNDLNNISVALMINEISTKNTSL